MHPTLAALMVAGDAACVRRLVQRHEVIADCDDVEYLRRSIRKSVTVYHRRRPEVLRPVLSSSHWTEWTDLSSVTLDVRPPIGMVIQWRAWNASEWNAP